MITVHFAVFVLLALLSFSLGRTFGRVQSSIEFSNTLRLILSALKKVETLAALKGEDISKLSTEELIHRTTKQLQIKEDADD